jgi:hypothetical protein
MSQLLKMLQATYVEAASPLVDVLRKKTEDIVALGDVQNFVKSRLAQLHSDSKVHEFLAGIHDDVVKEKTRLIKDFQDKRSRALDVVSEALPSLDKFYAKLERSDVTSAYYQEVVAYHVQDFVRTLYVAVGNKRYMQGVEQAFERCEFTPQELSDLRYLANDIRELSQAQHHNKKQPWKMGF